MSILFKIISFEIFSTPSFIYFFPPKTGKMIQMLQRTNYKNVVLHVWKICQNCFEEFLLFFEKFSFIYLSTFFLYAKAGHPVEKLIQDNVIKDIIIINVHKDSILRIHRQPSLAFPNFWVLDSAALLMFIKHSFLCEVNTNMWQNRQLLSLVNTLSV